MAAERGNLTQRYFIERYGAATLLGAVERAARQQRIRLIKGEDPPDSFEEFRTLAVQADQCAIPVNVERIAEQAGIEIVHNGLGRADGGLIPRGDKFLVYLRQNVPKTRRRFTLAHEIGHTLFYRKTGAGDDLQHQVNVMNKEEHAAEEQICSLFAGALLLPASRLQRLIPFLPRAPLPYLLHLFYIRAREFDVSIMPLIRRLGQLQPQSAPYLILHIRYRENRRTGLDPQLRIQRCVRFGPAKSWTIWNNRSLAGINLLSPVSLFDTWKGQLNDGRERTGGRYVWSVADGLQGATPHSSIEVAEEINLGILKQGKWCESTSPMRVASCLYAPPNATEREIDIISLMTSGEDPAPLSCR